MDILLTAFALLGMSVTGFLCWRCVVAERDCADTELRIEKMLVRNAGVAARMSAAETALESLRHQHQKLHGKFHATLREWESMAAEAEQPAEDDLNAPLAPIELVASTGSPVCANYALAQAEGPESAAARCTCNYCAGRRAGRAALREAAAQRLSHAETVKTIKANS